MYHFWNFWRKIITAHIVAVGIFWSQEAPLYDRHLPCTATEVEKPEKMGKFSTQTYGQITVPPRNPNSNRKYCNLTYFHLRVPVDKVLVCHQVLLKRPKPPEGGNHQVGPYNHCHHHHHNNQILLNIFINKWTSRSFQFPQTNPFQKNIYSRKAFECYQS